VYSAVNAVATLVSLSVCPSVTLAYTQLAELFWAFEKRFTFQEKRALLGIFLNSTTDDISHFKRFLKTFALRGTRF